MVELHIAHAPQLSSAMHWLSACRYCKFDIGGTQYTGLCDPNGRCYDVYKYQTAVTTMRVRAGCESGQL